MKLNSLCQCVALPLGTFSTKWCLSLKKMYSLYSLWMFPHCLSVASEAPLRKRKACMQLITSHDKKDHDGKTNDTRRYLWASGKSCLRLWLVDLCWAVSGCPSRSLEPARAGVALLAVRAELYTYTPLPRREVYAMGQCSRKPLTPCFVCYQREQDGIGLYGFVWEVFTQQSFIWLIFSSILI